MLKILYYPGVRRGVTVFFCSILSAYATAQDFALAPLPGEVQQRLHLQEYRRLSEVLKEVEARFGIYFLYEEGLDKKMIRTKWKIEPGAKEADIENSLGGLLGQIGLRYEKVSGVFVIKSKTPDRKSSAIDGIQELSLPGNGFSGTSPSVIYGLKIPGIAVQPPSRIEFSVTGKVTSNDGAELPGVNILLKGTTTGTTTDGQGNYKLVIPDGNGTLVFSFIGYLSEEVAVGNRSVVNVSLVPDVKSLSEVVVIGYGTEERKDLTGSIASVSGQELTKVPAIGIDQALQGRMAGVQVTSNSGDPGSTASVRIRGVGTIGYNDPLYVIDGVPTVGFNLNSINPSDIESIDVLKDASATAIYGSRAANGVVIVTTRRGKTGKTRFSFETYHGVQNAWRKVPLLNGPQHATVISEAISNANAQRSGTLLKPNPAFSDLSSVPTRTDWQDELFRPAGIHDYQLAASGGNDKSTFALSGSYRTQDGIVLNSSFQRYTFRLNSDHKVTQKLKVGNSLTFANSRSSNRVSNEEWNGVLFNALIMPPQLPLLMDSLGRYAESEDLGPGSDLYYGRGRNPIRQAVQDDRSDVIQRLLASGYAQYEIINGLVLRSDVGIDLTTNRSKRYELSFYRDGIINPAILQQAVYNGRYWNWDNTLTYSHRFGERHSVTALVGTAALDGYSEGLTAGRVGGFPSDAPANRFLTLGNPSSATNGSDVGEFSLFSTFARAAYGFNDKYLITATIRRDGSSKFLGRNKHGVFPSASVGWRISQEPFMQSLGFVSDLKLRASWGETGNQEVGSNYPFLTLLGTGADYLFGTSQSLMQGVAPATRGNPDIKWETITQKDIGLDLALLENRILLTADYYIKETRDMLLQVPIPGLGGRAEAPFVNAGSVRNRGVELAVTYRKTGGDFRYSVSFNGSHNTNEVTSLGAGKYIESPFLFRTGVPLTRTAVGHPIGSFYGFVTDGLFQSQEEVDAANALGDPTQPFQSPGTSPGDIRFRDIAGPPDENGNPTAPDGRIDANDRTFIGSGIPKMNYGLNFSASWKNFDFSLFFQGVQGVDIINGSRFFTESVRGDAGNKATSILDYWRPDNRDTSVPRLSYDDPNENNRASDRFVENGAYARLKNIQLGYSLPSSLTDRIGLATFRVYISSQNLFTITRYTGYDPEVGVNQNNMGNQFKNLEVGVDRGNYPQARIFLVGVNIGL